MTESARVPPEALDEADLVRELEQLHRTRHEAFLHAAADALVAHTRRTVELEDEHLRRHPDRDIDPYRTRAGARAREAARDAGPPGYPET